MTHSTLIAGPKWTEVTDHRDQVRDAIEGLTDIVPSMMAARALMFGLARTAGSVSALLLNLEGVFTTVFAWFVSRRSSKCAREAGAIQPAEVRRK
jgi:hypothetical protein